MGQNWTFFGSVLFQIPTISVQFMSPNVYQALLPCRADRTKSKIINGLKINNTTSVNFLSTKFSPTGLRKDRSVKQAAAQYHCLPYREGLPWILHSTEAGQIGDEGF